MLSVGKKQLNWWGFVFCIVLVFVDQLIKFTVKNNFPEYVVKNTGISWGLGQELFGKQIFMFLPFLLGILIFCVAFYILSKDILAVGVGVTKTVASNNDQNKNSEYLNMLGVLWMFSVVLVVSGGLSNLIDRFLYGYVLDYVKLPILFVMNFADFLIIVGSGLIILCLLTPKSLRKNKILRIMN